MEVSGVWEWSEPEKALFDDAIDHIVDAFGASEALTIQNDEWVQFLYHEAMWDWDIPADYRGNAYDAFVQYMDETYGIEWDDIYDWEAYREAYDAAG